MEIGIVGLGLIGGSMAKALKAHTPHRVWGAERLPEIRRRALEERAIDGALDGETLPRCALLLLALYPAAAADWVRAHARQIAKDTCVVDLCGVKRNISASLRPLAEECGFVYVGGHPMAGTSRSGYAEADAGMFSGASMILTPEAGTPPEALKKLEALFLSVGFGGVLRSTPEEHDRMIAYTSQLAHIVSSAYVKSSAAIRHMGFSAGSFRDMTRVAELSEEMWTELFLMNRDYLAEEVDALGERLAEYGRAIRAGDGRELRALLRDGRLRKEQLAEKEKEER